MNKLGLYLHIPFCKRKCNYCDFYSLTDLSLKDDYVSALCEDLRLRSYDCTGVTVDSVYFGGGTPSLLSGEDFSRIINVISSYYRVSEEAEITVEVNPSSVDMHKLRAMKELGVNRISMGMQSACDRELSSLGRLHNRETFDSAYQAVRNCGFDNISVDLMYGLPDQGVESLSKSIDYIVSLSCEHVSAYCLKIEEGTPFCNMGIQAADDDTAYEQYKLIVDKLTQSGYTRYEVSNFAKNGKLSRHNMKYWTGGEYLGFGPGAYSLFGGRRYGLERDILSYIHGERRYIDQEVIDSSESERERVILGLRLSCGVECSLLDMKKVDMFVKAGYMETNGKRAWLTTPGFFVSNAIISEFID